MVADTALIAGTHGGSVRRRASLRPLFHAARAAIGLPLPDLFAAPAEHWIVAEGTPVEVRRAHFLPGQIERIAGTEFGSRDEVVRDFRGGFESRQPPTIAYAFRDVLLFDGILHGAGALRHLRARGRRLSVASDIAVRDRGVMYESWPGNRWFGNWLCDDCLTYRLAERAGRPVTTSRPNGHMRDYERVLGIAPERIDAAWFDELILFDDRGHNESRRWRASEIRQRLTGGIAATHPGVYLLRGTSGDRRELRNEYEVAERLVRRGFRVIDPTASSLDEIVQACAGARIVAGVEGSQLVHGLMMMPPGAGLFVIQPPDRSVSVLKLITDRQGQDFGFVVGTGDNEAFSADIDAIDRTLDLF